MENNNYLDDGFQRISHQERTNNFMKVKGAGEITFQLINVTSDQDAIAHLFFKLFLYIDPKDCGFDDYDTLMTVYTNIELYCKEKGISEMEFLSKINEALIQCDRSKIGTINPKWLDETLLPRMRRTLFYKMEK
jgi:exonuclease I